MDKSAGNPKYLLVLIAISLNRLFILRTNRLYAFCVQVCRKVARNLIKKGILAPSLNYVIQNLSLPFIGDSLAISQVSKSCFVQNMHHRLCSLDKRFAEGAGGRIGGAGPRLRRRRPCSGERPCHSSIYHLPLGRGLPEVYMKCGLRSTPLRATQ